MTVTLELAHGPGLSVDLDNPDALVPPAYWHCPEYALTLGPEVADLNELFGYGPNPEQRLLLDGNFGMDRRGRLTAFEVAVFASRQNLKTGFMIQRAIGKAILLRRRLQIWTAHKESATDQAFLEFQRMREASEEFSRRVKAMPEGKGSKAIEFVNGCTIVFRPRTGKAGQSMSADDVDLDEYFAVEPKHEGSLLPTMSTRPNAQVGIASSAPHLGSHMQRTLMSRGRAAAEGRVLEPRLLYAEWSPIRQIGTKLDGSPQYGPPPCQQPECKHQLGVEGCIADNREVIKLANPSVGRSAPPAISWEYIADERSKLQGEALEEYFKERLGIGVEDLEADALTIFGPASVWKTGERDFVADGLAAVGVAMSADRRWIGLTGASMVEVVEDEDDPEAEPVDLLLVAPILHTADQDEAIAELKRLQDKHDCVVALDENGPAGTLLEELEDEDVAVETLSLKQVAKAAGDFHDGVTKKGNVVHLANAELDKQVAAAAWRWVGDHRVIGRRDGQESVDITLLEAAVVAADQAKQAGTFNIA